MTQSTVHVFIEGRVQGVWFRGWTRQEAKRLGVNGWVKNRRDGRVEAVFSGHEDGVSALIKACHKGPPLAKVTQVQVTPSEIDEHFGSFETRPTE